MSIAQSQRQELEDQGNAEIKNLNEQIKLLKLEEEAKEQKMNSKLQSALFGWSARRDKGLKVKMFHRWVQFVVINRYNRMSMDLQNQTSDTPKQPKQPDAELEISPPLTAAPSSSMVSAGGRHKLYQHAEMLEKENESLNQQLIKMQSEIERMSSTEQSANNQKHIDS